MDKYHTKQVEPLSNRFLNLVTLKESPLKVLRIVG